MRHPLKSRFLKPSLLILLLICSIGLVARSPQNKMPKTEAPLRLGLKVERNTLPSGKSTRITARFLDRFYQEVPNDGTRVVEFGFAAPPAQKGDNTGNALQKPKTDPGTFSEKKVTVGTGADAAYTTFKSQQTGRVIITATTPGLDPAQTVLVVTKPAPSLLSQLLDPVAYALNYKLDVWPKKVMQVQANGIERAPYNLSIVPPPPSGTRVRVRVDWPATIIYDGSPRGTEVNVVFADDSGVVNDISVISGTAAPQVNFQAKVLPDGEELSRLVEFTPPRPSRVRFDEDVKEILSTQHRIPISLGLTDDSGNPLQADAEKHVTLKKENDDDQVSFDPPAVVFSPSQNQFFAQTVVQLKGLPQSGEITLLAESPDNLKPARKTIKIRSPIERVTLTGPSEVSRGASAEYTVQLTDKDGNPTPADWDRKITLISDYGKFIPDELIISKQQAARKVQYVSADTTGRVSLKAESGGLKGGTRDIVLITSLNWLFIAALIGGLLGGAVRYFWVAEKSNETRPINWRALIGAAVGSIICGLFLFLAMKLGLSRALGALALPLDYGTWLVAFFFGGIGGFAGPKVFEWLVSLVMPSTQAPTSQPAAAGH